MLTDQEFTELVEDMNRGQVSLLAAALKDLWRYPSADERVLPYLEERLHDKTPCLLGIPYIFGEITRSGWRRGLWRRNERHWASISQYG